MIVHYSLPEIVLVMCLQEYNGDHGSCQIACGRDKRGPFSEYLVPANNVSRQQHERLT